MTMTLVAGGLGLLAVVFLVVSVRLLARRRPWLGSTSGLLGLSALSSSAALGALAVSVQGYHALTHEAVAATLHTRPLGEQIFLAELQWPDGSTTQYTIEGDQLYVDFEKPVMLKGGDSPVRVESPGYAAPCWADIDNDGKKDLLVGQFRQGKIHVFKNLGDNKFGKGSFLMAGTKIAEVPGVW